MATLASPVRSTHRRASFLFSIPCFVIAFSLRSCAAILISHGQCLDLLEFKKGLIDDSESSPLSSWLTGTDCCGWERVACEEASGVVVSLDLSELYISGNITTPLFNLTSLQRLNLAFNDFNPNPLLHIGNLANLTHLNLSSSGIVNSNSMGVSRLKNLVSLDLSSSSSGWEPNLRELIRGLSNLKELYLDSANISANGKEWCEVISDSAPRLEALSLIWCSLSGPIGSSLSKLRNLSLLRLDQNTFSSVVPDFFGNFSSLHLLSLSNCKLQGLFPPSVFQLKNLKVLDLTSNPGLSGYLPKFPEESALESLMLSTTNFSGILPDSLGNLKFLTHLGANGCHFSGSIPRSFGNLKELAYLVFSFNHLSGKIPPALGGASISKISLSNNNLTGPIPRSFGRLHQLDYLDLTYNSLNGSIPMSLFKLPKLQTMYLYNNKLSGCLEEISNASTSLMNVDLSGNNLQGEIPISMFDLAGLQILQLGSNKFNGTVELNLLGKLRDLSFLNLTNNELTVSDGIGDSSLLFPSLTSLFLVSCNLTTIPTFLKHKNNMAFLDLSNNKISGVVPKWIWGIWMDTYIGLNLSHNLFTVVEGPLPDFTINLTVSFLDLHSNMLGGSIPLPPPINSFLDYSNNLFNSSIPLNISNYLVTTTFFSLSNNSLTGELPLSICSATSLLVFDLSHNNLNGSIPSCIIENLTNLRVLKAQGNHFQGVIPQNVNSRCALQTINLRENKLKGSVPRSLANCTKLEVIDLGSNELEGSFPYLLVTLPALKILILRENNFHGQLTGICKGDHILTMLQIFDISSNRFTGSLSSDCFKNMKAVMIHHGHTETIGYRNSIFLPSYYYDTVTITVKGFEIELVKILTIFTSIDFSNNRFEGSLPEVMGDFKSLRLLNLSLNALSGQIPSSLGNMMEMESLDLSGNKLSGKIPSSMTSLTFLSFLNLSNNNLVGRIPHSTQLDTFLNSSFKGNPGLCGSPLSKQCVDDTTSVEPSSDSNNESPEFDSEVIWIWLFRGLGFGVGFASVIVYQMFFPKLKMWYKRRFMNR